MPRSISNNSSTVSGTYTGVSTIYSRPGSPMESVIANVAIATETNTNDIADLQTSASNNNSTIYASISQVAADNAAQDAEIALKHYTSDFNTTIANYSTTSQMNTAIQAWHDPQKLDASVISNYTDTTGMNTAIQAWHDPQKLDVSTASSTYKTITSFNSDIANYSTTSQMNTAISAYHDPQKLDVSTAAGIYSTIAVNNTQDSRLTALEATLASAGKGKTWTVAVSGGTHTTIAAAYSAASDGDTIEIYPGTWNFPPQNISKQLAFVGISRKRSIITSTATSPFIYIIDVPNVSFQNLTMNATRLASHTNGVCFYSHFATSAPPTFYLIDCDITFSVTDTITDVSNVGILATFYGWTGQVNDNVQNCNMTVTGSGNASAVYCILGYGARNCNLKASGGSFPFGVYAYNTQWVNNCMINGDLGGTTSNLRMDRATVYTGSFTASPVYTPSGVEQYHDSTKLDVSTAASTYKTISSFNSDIANYTNTTGMNNAIQAWHDPQKLDTSVAASTYKTIASFDIQYGYITNYPGVRFVAASGGAGSPALGQVYDSIASAISGASLIIVYPGTYTVNNVSIPANVTIRGYSKKRTILTNTDASVFTIAGANVSLLNLTITSNVSAQNTNVDTIAITSGNGTLEIRESDMTVNVTTTTGDTGVHTAINNSASDTMSINTNIAVMNCKVSNVNTGFGTNKAVHVSAGDLHFDSCQINCSSIGIAVETTGGECQLTGCLVNGGTSDISQTSGTIQINRGTTLLNHTANSLPFTSMFMDIISACDEANLDAGTRFMYLYGANTATTNVYSIRIFKPFIINGISVSSRVAPGNGNTCVFTLIKNGSPTSLTITLTDLNTFTSSFASSVSFAVGDTLSVTYVRSAGGINDAFVSLHKGT